ncbi:DEAD/DEAH box helicase [Candidatus Bathyarchaeota archaeon]|nr:DEAD/DEAH box helicase [Candidatus Bathyarchaeota archaeon]
MNIEELKSFDVPESVINKLKELGFKNLTNVQEEAIKKGLFEGKNLVVSAPTNTGKTFIAELAALTASKRREKKRTFYLVPLKALAEEKFEEFREKYSEWGMRIAITTSERTEFDSNLLEYDLIIATYEKLNALLIKNQNLVKDIGVVIIDELQMLSDETRGVNLEILLTRLIKAESPPQVIALSATTPNANELAEWLNAELVKTEKRELELREGILYKGKNSFNFKGYLIEEGDFLYKEHNTGNLGIEKGLNVHTFEGLVNLCKKEQVIIFCRTQREAEEIALKLSDYPLPATNIIKWIEKIDTIVESTPSTRSLKKCIKNGVAFHHAGLLPEEKRIVEQAFETEDIRAICSTTTLGAGVNTPAKTVIILSTNLWNGRNIKSRDYKNMSGRAGRIKYHDDYGRSILYADSEKEFERLWKGYIDSQPERVESQIPKRGNIEFSILNLVASNICKSTNQLIEFIQNTFFGYTYLKSSDASFKEAFQKSIKKQIQNLCEMKLLEEKGKKIEATELGKRCAEELLSPQTGYQIHQALKKLEDQIKSTSIKSYDRFIEPIIHLACCTPDANLLYMPRNLQEEREL